MSKSEPYWLGKRPLDGKRWAYTTSAVVLDAGDYHEKLFRMFRRYTKQWNDIELNMDRDLSEHTHEIHGAHIVGALAAASRCTGITIKKITGFLKSIMPEDSQNITLNCLVRVPLLFHR